MEKKWLAEIKYGFEIGPLKINPLSDFDRVYVWGAINFPSSLSRPDKYYNIGGRNRQSRTTQDRVSKGLRVRFPPSAHLPDTGVAILPFCFKNVI